MKLQLRYAFDHGDAVEALDKVAKLQKAGALNAHESEQYRIWAYRHLLAMVSHAEGLKACLKRIPDDIKAGELCVAIAENTKIWVYMQVRWRGHKNIIHKPSKQNYCL